MSIRVVQFSSLDGVVQAPGGADEDTDGGFAHGGWTHPFFEPDVVGGAFDAALEGADTLLFGRRTWQVMAAAWPERSGDPFGDRMNEIRKVVVSDSLADDEVTWNSERVRGDAARERLRELRASADVLVMGSSTLVRTLLFPEGLVDELRLIVMPVLLGGGKTIFPADGARRTFELASSETGPTGAAVLVYRRAG